MSRVKKGLILVFVILFTMFGLVDNISASGKWDNFDIRIAMPENVTSEDVKKGFEHYGRTNSPFYKKIDWIIEESESYGINPLYIIAKMNHESGWGESSLAKSNNNYGGMKKPGSSGSYQDFDSIESGVTAVIAQVKRYTEGKVKTANNPDGKKLTGIKEVLNTYCPESDGCDHDNYISVIGSMMERFGQTTDGTLLSGTATQEELQVKEDNVLDAGGRKVPLDEIYVERDVVDNSTGVKLGDIPIGSEMSNWFYIFSDNAKMWMLRIGWVLSFGLMGYVSLYMLAFLALPRGTRYEKFFTKHMIDVGEEASTNGLKGVWEVLKSSLIALSLMFLFATGAYIPLMAFVLNILEKATRWLI